MLFYRQQDTVPYFFITAIFILSFPLNHSFVYNSPCSSKYIDTVSSPSKCRTQICMTATTSTTTRNGALANRNNSNNKRKDIELKRGKRMALPSRTKRISTGKKKLKAPLPVTNFNIESIMKYYDRRPLDVGWRLNVLGLPLLGWYIGLITDKLLAIDSKESVQRKRGAELRSHLINSGSVAFIKSGQALSLRPDLIKNKIWAEELGKLVDAVGSFDDYSAMKIIKRELQDLLPRIQVAQQPNSSNKSKKKIKAKSKLETFVQNDPILSLFEFSNDNKAVASASIGQVYKARLKPGPILERVIGKKNAVRWGPDVAASAKLDMYLLRRTALWASKFRGGDLVSIADQFGMQLYCELDYIREADNGERFRDLYGDWDNVFVPESCLPLTRKKVLVQEWADGVKGPWGVNGLEMVRTGLRCSVDQLMHTGLFHADPHRGNLLRRTEMGDLAFIDFGMMADVSEEERYGLIGLCIGLQSKDLPLVTENLLKLGFLKDTTQLELLIPRLRNALMESTGGSGKASDVNFATLQGNLDEISRENVLEFRSPPFFTVIIRSLTILEGHALSVDPNFRLIRGAYPYVLKQLLSPEDGESTPAALRELLVRLLTVDGKEEYIEWERLRGFLKLARKGSQTYDPSRREQPKEIISNNNDDANTDTSTETFDLFFKFLTSKTGLFLKTPLVHELAEAIDGLASVGEINLLRLSRGLIRPLPGGLGPVNSQRMEEIQSVFDMIQSAFQNTEEEISNNNNNINIQQSIIHRRQRQQRLFEFLREALALINDEQKRQEISPIFQEVYSVCQNVAVEVLEIRGKRALRNILQIS